MTTPLTDALSLPAPLAQALARKGYEALTPVQAVVLEAGNAGQDLLVSAQTGSGKTVAFGLAMAADLLGGNEQFAPPDSPLALIIAPTRELALQVRRELDWLYDPARAAIASCVGGMDARTERRALERGAHIVVGTPGRLRDHLERGALDLSHLRVAVLDEADEMLDLGFREDLEFILDAAPAERRTLMFSATVSGGIARLAQNYQREARRITTQSERSPHGDIAYRALTVATEDSENAIVNVLRYYEARNTLVFCKTRAMVNHLTARLLNRGFSVVPLSGELAQDERARALQAMRDGRARVCVATDVAARGIDLPGLELVIHADLPSNRETLLHRSGRTGRAGRKGVSALIVPFNARRRTERLLAAAGLDAEWAAAPGAAEVAGRDTERLLTDAALTAPEETTETAMINLLVERFAPRELAAGVLRQYFAARSAPEDIAAVTPDGPKPRARTEFERSFWVSLGVGASNRAEPRWILPMLCRAGDLNKADIGAIRIFEDRTLVQLHADCEERFFNALGASALLEQEIPVTRTDAPGADSRPAPRSAPRTASHQAPQQSPQHERAAPPARKPRAMQQRSGPHQGPGERAAQDQRPRPAGKPPAEAHSRPARYESPRQTAPTAAPVSTSAPTQERPSPAPAARPKGTHQAAGAKGPHKPAGPKGAYQPAGPARAKSAEGSARPASPKSAAPRTAAPKTERPRFDPATARNPSARLDGPPKSGKPGKAGPKSGTKSGPGMKKGPNKGPGKGPGKGGASQSRDGGKSFTPGARKGGPAAGSAPARGGDARPFRPRTPR
ncbi:MAG: DEAD/DEAH box helicase [Pararhodobacter sp.]